MVMLLYFIVFIIYLLLATSLPVKQFKKLRSVNTIFMMTSNTDTEEIKKKRFLCLHGFRTSAKIMFMQTGVMRYHLNNADFVFLDAPLNAMGPPDNGVATVYPNQEYYEWIQMLGNGITETDRNEAKDRSVRYIIDFIRCNGPFDGLLGFSQGAAMAAGLAIMQELNDPWFGGEKLFSQLILIGGVSPVSFLSSLPDYQSKMESSLVTIPTLHVLGRADPLYSRAIELLHICSESSRTVLEHEEGHNIPSIRTALYPKIEEWIKHT